MNGFASHSKCVSINFLEERKVMKLNILTGTITLISILSLIAVPTAAAKKGSGGGFQTGFVRWRAAENGFAGWSLNGVHPGTGGILEFGGTGVAPGTDPYAAGTDNGANYYSGGSFFVGVATSP